MFTLTNGPALLAVWGKLKANASDRFQLGIINRCAGSTSYSSLISLVDVRKATEGNSLKDMGLERRR